MTMGIYSSAAFTSASGVAVAASAEVEVRQEIDGTLATIYADREGVTPLSNPFNADSNGRFSFYAAASEDGFRIDVTKGAETYAVRYQPIGLLQYIDDFPVIADFVGDAGSPSIPAAGLVPAPSVGDSLLNKFLHASGAWIAGAVNVLTTRGDIVRAGASGVAERLALGTSGYVLSSDGTDVVWAAAAGLSAASQAEQEAASSTTVAVTPGRQRFHPSAAKGWVSANAAGGTNASYNVTSVTDVGPGQLTVTWNVDFSSANYSAVSDVLSTSNIYGLIRSQAAGSTDVDCRNTASGTLSDPTAYFVQAFGDQ